jgi:hypothetical protein
MEYMGKLIMAPCKFGFIREAHVKHMRAFETRVLILNDSI